MKQPPTDEEINASIEAGLRCIAASLDWSALIAEAMAANPEPLKAALIQIAGRKDLYPPELVDFLALMEENKPKQGRPPKDGKESLRAAAKAWRVAFLKDGLRVIADTFNIAKKYDKRRDKHLEIAAMPHLVRISIGKGQGKAVRWESDKATDLALETMSDALMGTGSESLRNEIYPRKKKVQRKG